MRSRCAIHELSRMCLALGLVVFMTMSGSAYGQRARCAEQDEAAAKERNQRAEAYKTLDKFQDAANEYRAAFDICPQPFLLFNAGQMLWLEGRKIEALKFYRSYLELAPRGRAAPVAREQFFAAAEDLRRYNKLEQALGAYERYLMLAPDGDNVSTARLRVNELQEAISARQNAETKLQAEREQQAHQAEREQQTHQAERAKQAHQAERVRAVLPLDAGTAALDWRPLTVAGTGLAALFLGGVLHAQAMGKGDEYDRLVTETCPQGCKPDHLLPDIKDSLSSAEFRQRIAITSYVVGGATLSAGLVWFYLQYTRRSSHEHAATNSASDRDMVLIPLAGPRVIGGSLQMRF